MTTSSFLLARELKKLSRESLIVLLEQRPVPGALVQDYFDVADALLTPASIEDALTRVPRTTLVRASEQKLNAKDALLVDLGLAYDSDGHLIAYEPVTDVAEHLCTQHGIRTTDGLPFPADTIDADDHAMSASEGDPIERVGVERGIIFSRSLDDLCRLISAAPVRQPTGQLSASETLRLSAVLGHTGISLNRALRLLELAHLIRRTDGWILVDDNLAEWHLLDVGRQLGRLVAAWRNGLDPRVVALLDTKTWGTELLEVARWTYPLNQDWMCTLVSDALSDAEHLGLCTDGTALPIARDALRCDDSAVIERVCALLPKPKDLVYVQNDLSVVAPGLLTLDSDAFLRRLCEVEHSGLATTFRLDATRVNAALAAGLSAREIVARLEKLSATPLPQPVRYLIDEAGKRFGSIHVQPWATGSLVTCRDPHALELMLADISLTSLGWERISATTATTRANPTTTLEFLHEAKLAAVMVDAEGNSVVQATQTLLPRIGRPTPPPASRVIVDRLMSGENVDGARQDSLDDTSMWRERQVSLAIREKSVIELTFGMPDGSHKSMTVIPLSLTNGRLRARDAHTDVERTLPMENLVALSTPVA